jgi:hypothetical protein
VRGTASGSDDFQEATEMLQTMSSWSTKSPDLSNNVSPAQRIFAMLLCARFFIFKQLVQHIPVNTNVTDARRRWVSAQVSPPRLCDDGEDLFVKVLQALRGAETRIMLDIIRSSLRDMRTGRKDLFPMESTTPLFVVIDEAQVAAECLKHFLSGSGTVRRPILREMVSFFESTWYFNGIILSGTGLSIMAKVKHAVGSLVAKEAPSDRIFTDVGRFTGDDSSQETYINRYLNLSKDNISDRRLLERMKYWFCGRYVYYSGLQDSFSPLIIVTA